MSSQKPGHWVKFKKKTCVRSRGYTVCPIIIKLGQNVHLMKSRTSLKMGNVGSKAMSLDQILEKHCVRYRGHIFSPIIMLLGQNVRLDEISDDFENGSCQVKNYVTRPNLRKTLCVRSRGHIFSPIIIKPYQNVCPDEISKEFKNGSCQVKN